MGKVFENQLFTFDDGSDMLVDIIIEDEVVTDIIAAQDIYNFRKGDIVNNEGDKSLIRSEDIEVDFLKV